MAQNQAKDGSFASDMRVLLESGARADLTLVVGDSQLPAHSHILAARSPVFAAMLRHDMQQAHSRRIVITDVQEAVLRELLLFIYTDTTTQLDTMAAELLVASDKYDVALLKKICEQKMAQDICVDNATVTAALAVQHSCPLLKTAAVDYTKAHGEVLATEGWAQVMRNNIEVGLEICRQLAVASPPPPPSHSREISNEDKAVSRRFIEAAYYGVEGELWALLKVGAPIDARNNDNDTALHVAVGNGQAEAVKCLLRAGADANAINNNKETPLHKAVRGENVHIIWMLVLASARVDAKNVHNETPVDVACALSVDDTIMMALQLAAPQK